MVGPRTAHSVNMKLHQSWIQWDNHLFWLSGDVVFDAPECISSSWLPGHTPCSHWAASDQHPQIPFCRAALQMFLFRFIFVSHIKLSQVWNLAFLVKFHATPALTAAAPLCIAQINIIYLFRPRICTTRSTYLDILSFCFQYNTKESLKNAFHLFANKGVAIWIVQPFKDNVVCTYILLANIYRTDRNSTL